jgi:hypothetical protein
VHLCVQLEEGEQKTEAKCTRSRKRGEMESGVD